MAAYTRSTRNTPAQESGPSQETASGTLSNKGRSTAPTQEEATALLVANLEAARRRIAELEQAQEQRRLVDEITEAEARI